MKTWVVVASPPQAEGVRRALIARRLLRRGVRATRTSQEVAFPVVSVPAPALPETRVEERELASEPERPKTYRDLLHLPADQQAKLPRAFDVLGDVVLIRLPPELEANAAEIGEALLAFVPGARRVGWDRGVHGEARLRSLVSLAGTGPWRTRYRENGIEFVVDPEVAYFSPRLAGEHARVASEVAPGETVWDLCCGIGPFALAIAHRGLGGRILAVDSNPAAIALLRENAEQLGLAGRIESRNEPIESFLRESVGANRVVLNLPREGIKYLPSVSAAVAPGGTVHYYEVTPRTDRPARGKAILKHLEPAAKWTCVESRRVHPFSPQADLVAFTLRRN